MKNGSKRTISRLVAFVMLVSSIFTNLIVTNAKIDGTTSDEVVSGSAVATNYKWSADDLAEETFTANPELGGEIFDYSIISGKSKVTGNKKTFADGSSFEKRLQMGGTGKVESDSGVFTINAPSAGQLYVYAVTGSNDEGRDVQFYSADNVMLDSDTSGPITDASTYTYPVFVYDIAEAGTYKITSTSGAVNFYGMAFVAEGSVEEPTETTTEASTETTTSVPSGETGTPEAGKTYTADFKALTLESGAKMNGWTSDDGIISIISPEDKAYNHASGHGIAIFDGDQINVAVAGNADVSLAMCAYSSSDAQVVVTDSNGKVIDTVAAKAASDGDVVTVNYMGDATVLTFTLVGAGQNYLHSITAANAAAPVGEAKNFEIWLDDMAVDGTVATKAYTGDVALTTGETVSLGDSILELQGQASDQFTQSYGAAIGVIRDGKTVNGYKAGTRNANANDIATIPQQGDGCAIVFTPAATGMLNTYFVSTSFLRVWDFDTATGERYGYTDSEVAAESYGVKVEAGHTYVLSTTGKTNNMAYCGFEYVVDEPATIGVSFNNINANEGSIPNLEVYLTDATLGGEPAATVKSDTASVDLANGHTYVLSTNDGGVKATVAGSDRFTVTGDAIIIDLEDIPDVTLTGEITGTPEGTVTSMTFTNMVNGSIYNATITGNTYEVTMKPGEYNTSVVTTNGGVTYDRVSVVSGEENVNEVYVEVPETGNGAEYMLPTEVNNAETKLTLNGISANNDTSVKGAAGASIVVPVTGTQKITVAGWYSGTWNINGTNEVTADNNSSASNPVTNSYITNGAEDSVTINITGEGTTYLYWIKVEDMVAFKSEISVPGDYDTLSEAVAAINVMANRPEGEEGRVTINMTADIEEQVVFDAPYVTLNGNGHTLSWYYGVGTFYYSIDGSTGLYSERLYRDKYSSEEANGNLWGGVAIIRGDNFIAKDTTFLNTYNYYVTEKEASDVEHSVASMPERVLGADVTVYASKERSNAFYIDADNIEAYNCNILSSQDTLGRNGNTDYGYHAYFKDCVIGGNTDYICGEFTAIFDNCELQWKTFANDDSNNGKVGFITAPKKNPYIFRNCTVTTSGDEGEGVVSGLYGRTWGEDSQAYFINTETNGYITADGWGEMNAGDGVSSLFYEYNNTSNGEPFVTNGAYSKVLEDEAVIASMTSDGVINDYLNGWTPVSYKYEVNPAKLWGDVDGDGEVSVLDVSLALDYTLQPEKVENFDASVADVSGNGTINSEDVALILQKVLDSTFKLPVEGGETPEEPTETTTEATEPTTGGGDEPAGDVTVYVVGDSTACHYADTADAGLYIKRTGYGDKLGDYINANIVNLALSGRSSKSYTTDPEYQTLMNSVKAGDFVLIGFGHNDEKAGEADRYTAPGGTKEDEGTFKNSLYVNYILPLQEKGATPIIVTPIVRRTTGSWSDNQLHIANGGDYRLSGIELAEELGLVSIDATTLTKELYDTLTPEGSKLLHSWGTSKETSIDNTHLNSYGASYVAYLIANALKDTDSELAAYVKSDITAPATPAIEELVNPDYVEPDGSDPEDLTSQLWETTSPWYGSAFGNLGGESNLYAMDPTGVRLDPPQVAQEIEGIDNFKIEEFDGGDVVNIRAGVPDQNKSYGKIEGNGKTDGLIMYYQPISAAGNFEISGTITVNNYIKNNQVAFGAIISDNMKVDTNISENYKYVTAGAFRLADVGAKDAATGEILNGVTSYARVDGNLQLGPRELTEDIAPGTQIEVSIKKIGNKFTCTFNGSTSEYTVDMEGDAYAGFFAARSADITVSNISYNNEVVE